MVDLSQANGDDACVVVVVAGHILQARDATSPPSPLHATPYPIPDHRAVEVSFAPTAVLEYFHILDAAHQRTEEVAVDGLETYVVGHMAGSQWYSVVECAVHVCHVSDRGLHRHFVGRVEDGIRILLVVAVAAGFVRPEMQSNRRCIPDRIETVQPALRLWSMDPARAFRSGSSPRRELKE
jgi:hypothetical protein